MGNQGKIAKKKQSAKRYLFRHIPILSFIFEENFLLRIEKPIFKFSGVFESFELSISLLIRITNMLLLRLHQIIRL